jgi:hypothetical protein
MTEQPTSDLVGSPEAENTEGWITPDSLIANVRQPISNSLWSFPGLKTFQNQRAQRNEHAIEASAFDNLSWDPRFMELESRETLDPTAPFDGLPYFGTGSASS